MVLHLPSGAPRHRSRAITLLPRHWAWLEVQPRSASASLRLLVEEALHDKDGRQRLRQAQESCYAYLRGESGDRPYFEAAIRALFANDEPGFGAAVASWPENIRRQALALAWAVWRPGLARST